MHITLKRFFSPIAWQSIGMLVFEAVLTAVRSDAVSVKTLNSVGQYLLVSPLT